LTCSLILGICWGLTAGFFIFLYNDEEKVVLFFMTEIRKFLFAKTNPGIYFFDQQPALFCWFWGGLINDEVSGEWWAKASRKSSHQRGQKRCPCFDRC
jgi:hypothetical protein